MAWVAAIGAGGSLLSGLLGSKASSKAADTQAKSEAEAIAEQRRQYDLTRGDNAQFMNTGRLANQRLSQLMGLSGGGGAGGGGGISATGESADALRARLIGQFTNPGTPGSPGATPSDWYSSVQQPGMVWNGTGGPEADAGHYSYTVGPNASPSPAAPWNAGTPSSVDEAGLAAAIAAAQGGAGGTGGGPVAGYGDLTRRFTMADRDADPVYRSGLEFGLAEGTKGLNNRAQQAGMWDSGATLKALSKYANDYGSTKAEGAYNRFNTDNTTLYNRLAGLGQSGQTANSLVNTAGTNSANQIGKSLTGAGNDRAAGIIGGANAWGDAIGGVANAGQQYFKNQRLKDQMKAQTSQPTMGYDYGGF